MTHRTRLVALAAVSLAALALPTAALAQTRLIGIVQDPATITLTDEAGARVSNLAPGTYTVEVRDRSSDHNFHLTGPGVDQRTDVGFIGTVTWTVTLQIGRYTYVCDPHASTMRGSFTVGSVTPAPPPSPPPPAPAPRTQTLVATVGPGFTISLRTASGRRVTRLRAGRYRIVVRDRSAAHNFHLIGRGVNKTTRVGFRGTSRWTVTLRRGTYRYVCDPHARGMRGSFRVT